MLSSEIEKDQCSQLWQNYIQARHAILFDAAASARWHCSTLKSIPQRLSETTGLYSLKIC